MMLAIGLLALGALCLGSATYHLVRGIQAVKD